MPKIGERRRIWVLRHQDAEEERRELDGRIFLAREDAEAWLARPWNPPAEGYKAEEWWATWSLCSNGTCRFWRLEERA